MSRNIAGGWLGFLHQADSDDEKELAEWDMTFAKWKENSLNTRAQLEMSRDWYPWTNKSPAPLLRLVPPQPRVLELINIAWGARLSSNDPRQPLTAQELCKDYFVDISQDVARKPWGTGMSTMTRGVLESK